MFNKLATLVFIAGTCSVVSAQADEFAPVKCGTNQERVWVYDSLTTFDVHAQIRCNENVQIISRVKGYAKVRIKDGSEGYVADSSLPSLPPFDDSADKPANSPGRHGFSGRYCAPPRCEFCHCGKPSSRSVECDSKPGGFPRSSNQRCSYEQPPRTGAIPVRRAPAASRPAENSGMLRLLVRQRAQPVVAAAPGRG